MEESLQDLYEFSATGFEQAKQSLQLKFFAAASAFAPAEKIHRKDVNQMR